MEAIIIIFFLITLIYILFIGQLISGYHKIKDFETSSIPPTTKFSLIVPCRNEAKNLPKFLRSIAHLNYPQDAFELILIDDFSTDNSARIFNQWRMQNGRIQTTLLENLRLSNSPKKDAITRAVPIIKHPWIITTDADCVVAPNWLQVLDQYIQKTQAEMLVGAVVYTTKNNWFHHFQQFELLALQATTIGSFGIGKPFMCNGANFAYSKDFFNRLGGFGGITDRASGDDVLLLQKAIKKEPTKVQFVKNPQHIVKTKPENDLYQLFMQRVRWASKTSSYKNTYAQMLAVVVLLMNTAIVAGILLSLLGKLDYRIFLIVFTLKYLIDYSLMYPSKKYLLPHRFVLPVASSLIYPLFSVLVGYYSLFGGFTWKGRSFSK